MRALIDADNLAFACAASAEEDPEHIAIARARDMVERILHETSATEYELWLSGPHNFRLDVYPEYKAGRIDKYRPRWEKEVKEYLTTRWDANWSDGCEADDMLGVRLTELGDFGIMCHLDKDMNMIAGRHYNWELTRLGKVIREAKIYYVTPNEGDRFFYYQMLTGDPTDNIKGVVGIGPKKAEGLLIQGTNYNEWYDIVKDAYGIEEEFLMNGQCLWIWRKANDIWNGLKREEKPS
jgi:DNA polymerase-1